MDATSTPAPQAPSGVSFVEAFRFWLKLGFISFGGPAGQISVMHQELVERKRWISERRFLHALNYCMLLPGPEAQQLATYIGWLMHRTWGGIIAGGLFVLPSLFILTALSWIYVAYGEVPLVGAIFYGIKPAVTAIVLFAAYRIGSRALQNGVLWAIAAAAFVGIFAFHVPFPIIIAAAALIGAIGGKLAPEKFKTGGGHGAAAASHGPSVIDDETPVPRHALFSWPRLALYAGVGLGLWALVIGTLTLSYGWNSTLTQIGWFFTKAAMLTFGGAYAVLPYVYQGGVEEYGWLTAPQMIDGLALGETTPGPLIMVVAFVGFLGAWGKEIFGPDNLLLAGAAGATVATFFTFLPSFLFILIGGPLVESTRGNIGFTAPLTAITAAVVGVILNLAVFFAYHVLWPQGYGERFDWISALIGIAAFLALWRYKIGIMQVIGACAALGVLLLMAPSPVRGERLPSAPAVTQLTSGKQLYDTHCAACHGAKLEGQPNWRERLPTGKLPAPPHDETGHTWHHPDRLLFDITKNGIEPYASPGYRSDMPAFDGRLSDDEIRAVLAYIKSTWPEETRKLQAEVERSAQAR